MSELLNLIRMLYLFELLHFGCSFDVFEVSDWLLAEVDDPTKVVEQTLKGLLCSTQLFHTRARATCARATTDNEAQRRTIREQ